MLICATLLPAGCALLVGCQNAPNQMSLYAPFGPSALPPPSLTRANSTPYYTPGDSKGATPTTPTTATADGKDLSHYDPYRGILVPGTFTPAPVVARSTDTWGPNNTLATSSTLPREKPSQEEPIKVVENSSATSGNFIAAQPSAGRSGAVQFKASTLSGAVRPGANLAATPSPSPGQPNTGPRTVNAVEVARLPKPPVIPTTPVVHPAPAANPPGGLPGVPGTPGLLPTPLNTPAPKPGEPRRVSLWNDPGDGSRVMPASHLETQPSGNLGGGEPGIWRSKR